MRKRENIPTLLHNTTSTASCILHREFAESTILTIAHRLRTVIDYDRVSPHSLSWHHAYDNWA